MGARSLKTAVLETLSPKAAAASEFWALRNVAFEVAGGETLGIIGSNGAGKSTLLALLAGTKQPTEGTIRTRGTISSLLELGAGFHPDLTGRENVYLAGAVMGLSRQSMRERFDAIVEFSGIGDFIDQPVRHYSSGMYVRLGFSVAVEVDPDILLIDEVLSVGDIAFQKKCIDTIKSFRDRGKTMLVISHDLSTIQTISDRILFLEEGQVQGIGKPIEVVGQYTSSAGRKGAEALGREWGSGEVRLSGFELRNGQGVVTDRIRSGDALEIRIEYTAAQRIENPVFGFSLADDTGAKLYGNNSQIEKHEIAAIEGEGSLTLRIESVSVASGTYLLSFSVHSADHSTNYHRLDNALPIMVESDKPFEGCYLPVKWSGP
jgi:ABC-type polysaccharide/polyol phosphate transport system ATPase subunit